MKRDSVIRSLAVAAAVALGAACPPHDHPHEESAGHAHGGEAHAHEPAEHGDHPHDPGEHGDHPHEEGGHDDHGHGGHDGASEVVTLWGASTQLFVEFPALVRGEASPFAAHLTRLHDHFAIDEGTVVVELSGGDQPVERFTVERPSVPGIFRPEVTPFSTGPRRVTLHLTSPAATELHDLGEFTVFATRAEADVAATDDAEGDGEISYLLEQQWQVPFRVEAVQARSMRPSVPAFAVLEQPPGAESVVVAPRAGRVVAAGGRAPFVGESVEPGAVLFRLTTAPQETEDLASLDAAVDQAQIRVDGARREVERLAPLVAEGVVPARRADEAANALAAAEAELRGAARRRAGLAQAQRVGAGGDTIDVPASIGGVVAELLVSPGTWVEAGAPLARVVGTDQLVLSVGVPEAYVGRIGEISGAWFRLTHAAEVLEVPREALLSVGTELDSESRTLAVRFALDNLRGDLFAGQRTQAHLLIDAPRVTVAARAAAVVEDAGVDVVYVQTGGESFERRVVQTGIRDGDDVEIVDGLAPGEWVVTTGAYTVRLASMATESMGHGHAH